MWLLMDAASGDGFYSELHPLLYTEKFHESYRKSSLQICIQNHGETIFVPDNFGHAVINLETSVALAVEFEFVGGI